MTQMSLSEVADLLLAVQVAAASSDAAADADPLRSTNKYLLSCQEKKGMVLLNVTSPVYSLLRFRHSPLQQS